MPAIKVENLFKEYVIGGRKERHRTIREALAGGLKSPLRRLRRREDDPARGERFLALNDVSFEVAPGEAVGIIGRNGAGKSTLLKIFSRITEPTAGRVELSGRVSSLLEVGTGFHPDLTGRENIFLNGVILGMSRAEIRMKLDEIVAFSEIERFLDTPVKRYSSGMYVRLAFSVAAHLEPEILIIDEVLSVGDARFQRKCLGKMEEAGKEGRTVLFVTHNMQAVRHLCGRAIWLRAGTMACDGDVVTAIESYLQDGERKPEEGETLEVVIRNLPPDPAFRLEGISLTQNGRPVLQVVENGSPLEIAISFSVLEQAPGLRVFFELWDEEDTLIFRSFHDEDNEGIGTMDVGRYCSRTAIPADILGPVLYEIRVRAGIFNRRSCIPASGVRVPIRVENTGRYNRAYLRDTFRGKLAFHLRWDTVRHPSDVHDAVRPAPDAR